MGSFNRGGGFGNRSFGRRDFGGNDRGRGFDRGSERREMFKAVCSNCGKECEVPFRPTGNKPVYCSDCFEKMGGRDRETSDRPRFEDRRPREDQSAAKFDAINVKLDRILKLLEPKTVEDVSAQSPVKELKKSKPKKVAPVVEEK